MSTLAAHHDAKDPRSGSSVEDIEIESCHTSNSMVTSFLQSADF